MTKKMSGVNPWVGMWLQPRKTVSHIVEVDPKHRFLVLSFLYGCPMLLHFAQNFSLGESFSGGAIGIVVALLATFLGMLGISVASLLFFWTGKWIGGQANYLQVRAAVSWSNVPNALSIVVWILLFMTFGDHLFMKDFNQTSFEGQEMAINGAAFVVQGVLSIWSFIMLIKGLGAVQAFSAWKGILNVLIPFFMVGIFMWAISWVVFVVSGMMGT